MPRVLVIGYAPDAVDFSDPAVPPGLDEARVAAGLKRDVELMHARGWEAEHLPIRADDSLRRTILDCLAAKAFDCIVIGAGVRMTTKHVAAFEQVVDAVQARRAAYAACLQCEPGQQRRGGGSLVEVVSCRADDPE